MVICTYKAVPIVRFRSTLELWKQRLPCLTGARSCRVAVPVAKCVHRRSTHVTGRSNQFPRQLLLDDEVPGLNVATSQVTVCNKTHLRGWRKRNAACTFIWTHNRWDALRERVIRRISIGLSKCVSDRQWIESPQRARERH